MRISSEDWLELKEATVSKGVNLKSPSVGAPSGRSRHDEHYQESLDFHSYRRFLRITRCIQMSCKAAGLVMHGLLGTNRLPKPISERSRQNKPTRMPIVGPLRASHSHRQVMNIFSYFTLIWFATFLALFVSIAVSSARENYPNGFPNDPNFFPIGVWLQSPAHAPAYKAIGINTFVGLWNGPTENQLVALAKSDMLVVASQNEVGLNSVYRGIIRGWLQDDEPDNAQPSRLGFHVSCVPANEVVRRTEEMKARDDTRPVMINFGQGLVNKYWWGRGLCTGDENYYSVAAREADILSFDIYPVGSSIPQVKGKLEYVAQGVTRLTKLAVNGQKVWAVIETTALDPKHAVTPAQVRAEVWMAIIHGARGIVYFVHEFLPIFREDAIFRHPDVVEEVDKENKLIKSLANVLNSPNLYGTVTVQSSVPIGTVAKRYNNTLYIFAVAMTNFASQPRFTLQGLNGTEALVVGEKRNVTIAGGVFEDRFAGYGVHIYKIPLTDANN